MLEGLLDSDVGYRDFKNLRGSPDYWDQAKKDMFAMLRQLGQPTFFLTLSSADTKWPELLGCLYKLRHGRDATEEELASLTSAERMALVRNDPITTARYFKARADALRTHMLKRCPDALGGMGDYFFRVEFQQRGERRLQWMRIARECSRVHRARSNQPLTHWLPIQERRTSTHSFGPRTTPPFGMARTRPRWWRTSIATSRAAGRPCLKSCCSCRRTGTRRRASSTGRTAASGSRWRPWTRRASWFRGTRVSTCMDVGERV